MKCQNLLFWENKTHILKCCLLIIYPENRALKFCVIGSYAQILSYQWVFFKNKCCFNDTYMYTWRALVIIAESLEECVRRLLTWKEAMEKKGLRINAGKTCRCTWCQGTARPLDGRQQKEVQVGPDMLEVVASFCYLGDMLSEAGGCELSTTTRVKTAWKKFNDLLPVLSSRHLSFKTRGRVYRSCVRSEMLHASETWPLTKPSLQHLQLNARAMIRQICNVRPQDIVINRSCAAWHWGSGPHSEGEKTPMVWICGTLQWCSQDSLWHTGRWKGLEGPRWHGSSWQRGIAESGSSRQWTLMTDIPGDLVWDLPCLQQASYLERGPLMWMLPLYLHVNQKSGPSCSKLTMSLVNDSLKFTSSDTQIFWNFLLKKCE